MNRALEKAAIVLLLVAVALAILCVGLLLTTPAQASEPYACGVTKAQTRVAKAHAAVERAETRLSETRHVLRATRYYSAHDYSDFAGRPFTTSMRRAVGRWVLLARRTGWTWRQIGTLMHVVARESAGNPAAKNPSSTASGLLQFLSDWWYGKWNPFNAFQNLLHGWMAVRSGGWGPWVLNGEVPG